MKIPALEIETNYDEFIMKSIDYYLDRYLTNYKKIKEEFAETPVHDFRVSIRRFSALCFMLEEIFHISYLDELRKSLKQQLRIFSKLRDTQVQILKLQKMIFRYPALYTFFVDLRKKEQKLIKKATLYSKQAVTSDIKGLTEFTKMKLKNDLSTKTILINDLLSPARNAYIIVLELIALADANNLLSIHKVRIAYKRFRYIMEILSDIYNLTPDELKKLKEFQDIMGFLQDNNVITTKLNSFILKQDIIPYADYEKALTSFARSRKTLLNKFFKVSKEFEKNWGYILTH